MSPWNELRQVCRNIRREPGFAAAAILTIALGVGANTAIFSFVNGVLLRPLAYRDAERLVGVQEYVPALAERFPLLPASARHFMEWRERCTSFESLSALMPASVTLTGAGEPERVDAEDVSANLFETLGVQPSLGRGFAEGEDGEGAGRVALISDSLWRRRFNSDPAVVGKTIALDTETYTVVGVLPPTFRYPPPFALSGPRLAKHRPEIYRPLVFSKDALAQLMGMFNYSVIGRLKRGVTREQALAELNVIAAQLVKMSGQNVDLRAAVRPLGDAIAGGSRRGLMVLLGAVGCVLLIVCVNLANLMVARGERKAREAAIRTALGASRGQMLRHALMESLVIALAGGALGIAAAAIGLGTLVRSAPAGIPRLAEVSMDVRVLLFALAISAAAGLLFGLPPAWRAASTDPQRALKAGGRSATGTAGGIRLRGALVTAEVALSAVLLVTATLLMSSFSRLWQADKGFQAPATLAGDMALPWAKYREAQARNAFHERLLADLASRPGVLSAAISNILPLQGEMEINPVWLPGDTRPRLQRPAVNMRFVSPGYWETMGIAVRGRGFKEGDRTRRVAVLSESAARMLWPGQDPIGREFERGGLGGGGGLWQVIGVARDVRADVSKQGVAMVYCPYWEAAPGRAMLAARAAGDPRAIAGTMRAAIANVDGDVSLSDVKSMDDLMEESVAERRFQMRLAAVFGGAALLLASLGIYGVVAYSVSRRTNEIGIRFALGAKARDVYAMVLRQGMKPVVVGLIAGLAGAVAAGRLLSSLLYEVSPRDPFAIGTVALLLFTVGLAACLIPARRAASVEPLEALREE